MKQNKNKRKRISRPKVRIGCSGSMMMEARLAAAARNGCIESQNSLLRSLSI